MDSEAGGGLPKLDLHFCTTYRTILALRHHKVVIDLFYSQSIAHSQTYRSTIENKGIANMTFSLHPMVISLFIISVSRQCAAFAPSTTAAFSIAAKTQRFQTSRLMSSAVESDAAVSSSDNDFDNFTSKVSFDLNFQQNGTSFLPESDPFHELPFSQFPSRLGNIHVSWARSSIRRYVF